MSTNTDYISGVVANTFGAAEGSLLPPPQKGSQFRVPTVTGIKVEQIIPYPGGTQFILSWSDPTSFADSVDHYNIYVKGVPGAVSYNGSATKSSPGIIYVPISVVVPLIFTIQTVLKNGLLSDINFSPTTSALSKINIIENSDGSVSFPSTVNTTGYKVNNTATLGNVLRGNGTNFVSSQLNYSDLSTNIFNVLRYGAIGDWNGSTGTDDTAAIQAAITAASVVGGRVYFPGNHSYKTTSVITLPGNYSNYLYGDNDGQFGGKIHNAGVGNTFYCDGTGFSNLTQRLEYMVIDGNASSLDGIAMLNCNGARLSHLWVINHHRDGVRLTNSYDAIIEDVRCVANTANGLNLFTCNNARVLNGVYNGNGINGISCNGTVGNPCLTLQFIGPDIESNSNIGLAMTWCMNPTIRGHFEGNVTFDIWDDGNSSCFDIQGCLIGGGGMWMTGINGFVACCVFGGSNGLTLNGTSTNWALLNNKFTGGAAEHLGTSGARHL